MADTSGWITIKQMVQEILFETDRGLDFYKKCMHYVINGVREMNLLHYDNVKTTKVTCNSLGIIPFPSDFVEFTRLSINSGGLIHPLTRQPSMVRTLSDGDDDGSYSLDSNIGEGVALDDGGNYGYATFGGKNDYYYDLDYREKRILVRSLPGTSRTFFLQYVSSGVNATDGNSTQIPVKLKKVLKMYVLYQDAIMSDLVDKRLIPVYERQYNGAVSELNFIELPTADELQDMIYATYSEIRR